MRNYDTAQLEALLDDVNTLHDRVAQLVEGTRSAPPAAGRWGGLVWRHGIRGLESAVDHLRAWRLLSRARPRTIMAHYALLRSAVDGGAAARWIFEPAIDAGTRAGRALRAEHTDLKEQEKMEQHGQGTLPSTPPPTYPELIAELLDAASEAGVHLAPWSESRYTALAARYAGYPSTYAGTGAYMYSVLSAATHGRLWAGVLAKENAVLRRPDQPDIPIMLMDASTATWLTEKVLYVVERAIRDAERYAAAQPRP